VYRLLSWIQAVLIPHLGPFGLFVVAFFDSSFLSLPEVNDLLIVSSAIGDPEGIWLPVLVATSGSVAGSSVLWALGRRGGQALLERRFGSDRAARTRAAYRRWGVLALAVPALLPPPMPFKVFVLAAGVLGFPLVRLVATLFLARGARYAFWGAMGVAYGREALEVLRAVDRWSAERLPVVLALAGAGLLAGLLFYLRRRRLRAGIDVGGVG
jgi:membrane protein YqaA with SNARE-associated domain